MATKITMIEFRDYVCIGGDSLTKVFFDSDWEIEKDPGFSSDITLTRKPYDHSVPGKTGVTHYLVSGAPYVATYEFVPAEEPSVREANEAAAKAQHIISKPHTEVKKGKK